MRYFKTSNASRLYKAGGLSFAFDPMENIGGIWSGVLAVEDDSAAGILAAAKFSQVEEITAEDFDGLKKKPLNRSPSYIVSQALPSRPSPALQVAPSAAKEPEEPQPAAAQAPSPAPKIKTRRVAPPDDLG